MPYNYRLARCQGAITSGYQTILANTRLVIDGVIMKGRCIIIPKVLQQQALNQLHVYHMGIEKKQIIST